MKVRPAKHTPQRALFLLALAVSIPARAAADAINGTWVPITPASTPPYRSFFGAIYDPLRERLIVDGGYGPSGPGPGCGADTWAFSLSGTPAWTQMPMFGAPRVRHATIYDPLRDRMLLFSTQWCDLFGYDNYVWAYSLAGTPSWSNLNPAGTWPAGRIGHSAIYDPVRDRMLVFGGLVWGTGQVNQVWELSLSGTPTWTQIQPTGAPPSPRSNHSAIYDPVRDVMLVFGGGGYGNELWQLTLDEAPTWSLVVAGGTPPAGRAGHSAIYDPVRDRMVVFAGATSSTQSTNDVWALTLAETPAWSQLAPTGTPPVERSSHEAIYDPPRDRMIVHAGQPAPPDLWALEWGPPVGVEPPQLGRSTMTLQARPNPSASDISVDFALPRPGAISLEIYDVRGSLVRVLFEGEVPAGPRQLLWDRRTARGEQAVPGVYHLRLRSAAEQVTERFVLVN